MEPITRETFNRWAQKNNWMQTGETVTANGRQYTFLTPSGVLIIGIFDLKGNLMAIGQPAPMSQVPPSRPLVGR